MSRWADRALLGIAALLLVFATGLLFFHRDDQHKPNTVAPLPPTHPNGVRCISPPTPGRPVGLVPCVALTPDASTLAYGAANVVVLLDVNTGRVKHIFGAHTGPVLAVEFDQDGRRLASASFDGSIRLWDISTYREIGTLKVEKPENQILDTVAFSPSGTVLISGDGDVLRLWNLASQTQQAAIPVKTYYATRFFKSGNSIAVGGTNLQIVDLESAKVVRTFAEVNQASSVHCIAIRPDGGMLASARFGNEINLWDAKTGKLNATLTAHKGPPYSLAFSPDGTLLASGGDDKTVRLWSVATGKEIVVLKGRHTNQVCYVRFSTDGKRLVSASYDAIVEIWDLSDLRTGEP
jgi:WD40 repeat protein